MMDQHAVVANEAKAVLIGTSVVRAQLGYGSIVLLDLLGHGEALRPAYLRIECAWSIQDADAVVAASEDDRAVLSMRVSELHARAIRNVEVRLPGLQLRLIFDVGELNVFPLFANTTDYDNWTVHAPDGRVLVAGPGRQAHVGHLDEQR